MIKFDEYKDGIKYGFPKQKSTNPKDKELPEYSKRYCKAIYSAHIDNRASVPYDWYSAAQTLRDYAAGKQNEDQYLEQISGNQSSGKSIVNSLNNPSSQGSNNIRKGYGNLNTKIISVAPNLMSVVHGLFENYEEDIFVNAIDPLSGEEEANNQWGEYTKAKYAPYINFAEAKAGIGLTQDQLFPESISLEELDQFKALGGFKVNWAIAMEEVLKYTDIISDWDRGIKRKAISDILTLNMLAAKGRYDTEEKVWKYEYIDPDPSRFVMQYSIERDFNDSEYGGHYKLERISTLVQKGINADELKSAAKKFCDLFGNPSQSKWSDHDTQSMDGSFPWFDYIVPVLHCAWIDSDISKTLKYTKANGSYNLNTLAWEDVPKPLSKRKEQEGYQQEIIDTNRRFTYQASWVVGTEVVYDYGKMLNQPKDSNGRPRLPFVAFRGEPTNINVAFGSIIENIIPFLDQIQLAWLRLQDVMAKAINDGLALNLRLLNGLNMGGDKITAAKAFEMLKKTSIIPYLDVSAPGQNYKGGAVNPVTRIQGGVGTRLQEEINLIQLNLSLIERFTGISPAALGASPTSGESATATQLSMQGTKAVLQPYINGIFDVKRRLAEYATMVIPILLRNQKGMKKVYSRIIGEKDVEFLANQVNKLGIEFGLYTEARPTHEDKQSLIEYINIAMQPRKDGASAIDFAQGMKLRQQVNSGANIKNIWMAADFLTKKEQKRQQQIKDHNIQLQGQQNMMLKQEEVNAKLTDNKMQVEGQLAVLQSKYQADRELMILKHDLETISRVNQEADAYGQGDKANS